MLNSNDIEKSIYELDITGRVEEKSGNFLGDAHEYFVVAILMRLGFNEVGLAEDSADRFDLQLGVYSSPPDSGEEIPDKTLKVQIKASSDSASFTGGTRAGADRKFSGDDLVDKSYIYSADDIDLLIAVDKENLDLYLIPIRIVEDFGTKSKSFNKMNHLKNNWNILLNWNKNYILELKDQLPDFS